MKSRLLKALGLTLLLFIAGWGYFRSTSPRVHDLSRVRDLYGGANAMETINKATTIQAYRLPSPSLHTTLLADYTMSSGPIVIPDAVASKLRRVLMNDSAYLWDVAKACGEPDYGVRFQFQHGAESVDVLICFKCQMLGTYHNGKAVEYEDFDPIRREICAIAKELFADDTAIQSLK